MDNIKKFIKNNQKLAFALGVILIALIFLLYIWFFVSTTKNNITTPNRDTGVLTQNQSSSDGEKKPKLLLLGMDGATWDIINPLIEEGKLPNLKSVIDSGVRATPDTLNPTISPAIWTSVVTGVNPQRHGINNFLTTNRVTHDYKAITSEDRRVKTLWNILSDAGNEIGIFSYWATWPPEEEVKGYNITERALFKSEKGFYPEELKFFLLLNSANVLGESSVDIFDLQFPEAKDPNDAGFFKGSHKIIQTSAKLFIKNSLFFYDKEKPDILFQIYGLTDLSQHLFLKFKYLVSLYGLILVTVMMEKKANKMKTVKLMIG